MKRLILAAVTVACTSLLPLTCQANADSLGANKDCASHPVSQYGMDSIAVFSQYRAEPKKFMDAMTAFCSKGKTMGDMGLEAAYDHSLSESRKWVNSNLPSQSDEQRKFSDTVAYLLHNSMLNGFSGFDYPKPPEQSDAAAPARPLNPGEICDAISSKAAEHSASQLPPQVQISLSDWNEIKSGFEMACLVGIMSGNNHKSADGALIAGLNDIARDVYSQAYEIGSRYPKYRAPETGNEKTIKEKERAREAAEAAAREKAAADKRAAHEQ